MMLVRILGERHHGCRSGAQISCCERGDDEQDVCSDVVYAAEVSTASQSEKPAMKSLLTWRASDTPPIAAAASTAACPEAAARPELSTAPVCSKGRSKSWDGPAVPLLYDTPPRAAASDMPPQI